MEISGKIIAVMPASSGTSQRTGNTWMSQDYVIETHDQYPKKCVFRVFGEDKIKQFAIQPGEELTVSFDIDAHEYNGRWYNDIRAWAVARAVQQQPAAAGAADMPFPPTQPSAQPFAGEAPASTDSADDLPF